IRVNGRPVDTPERLTTEMKRLQVGDTLHLTLFRDGETKDVEFVLPERPVLPQDILTHPSVAPAARTRSLRLSK
ncbi:MAG TPA: hypothetical protein VLM91_22165, partial [Candidatus Methylomirabilis sp.]|nr:hypothetical protein [Candidatus Methylomirabilis sp.]